MYDVPTIVYKLFGYLFKNLSCFHTSPRLITSATVCLQYKMYYINNLYFNNIVFLLSGMYFSIQI